MVNTPVDRVSTGAISGDRGVIMPTKEEEAIELARKHYEIEDGMIQIFRITGPDEAEARSNEPIKLLEVNENTVPAGIMPLGFGPSPSAGLHYSTVIVEITPDEFERIRNEEWELPHGWKVGEPILRGDVEAGSHERTRRPNHVES